MRRSSNGHRLTIARAIPYPSPSSNAYTLRGPICMGKILYILYPSIHRSMGSAPVGAQCPLTSSLGEFLGYRLLALVSWAFTRVSVHRPSLRLSYLGVFYSLFFTCHWIDR